LNVDYKNDFSIYRSIYSLFKSILPQVKLQSIREELNPESLVSEVIYHHKSRISLFSSYPFNLFNRNPLWYLSSILLVFLAILVHISNLKEKIAFTGQFFVCPASLPVFISDALDCFVQFGFLPPYSYSQIIYFLKRIC